LEILWTLFGSQNLQRPSVSFHREIWRATRFKEVHPLSAPGQQQIFHWEEDHGPEQSREQNEQIREKM
jgi:hypothetical protein